ncbi:MAG: RluA family pseudouridine synthase [Oscillospiraceae bacterium]|nr:RluA family pseudouridine synthase [Oscillospiraceae bacterium]
MERQSYFVQEPCALLPFLLENGKGKSRNNLKSLLKWGQIWVDGKPVRQFDYPLRPGQRVEIRPPEPVRAVCPFPVLYEDEDILVVDKPAGILTIATERVKDRTVYRQVNEYLQQKNGGRVFIVHRLDRDTSGVLLFAKTEAMKRLYQDNWATLVRRRGYLAVTEGQVQQQEGTVRSELCETKTHLVYSVPPGQGGKTAVTHYRVLARQAPYTLLALDLETGRKNQIRVHLADLGHPVAGDKQYGAKTNPIGRLALHANALELTRPVGNAPAAFYAPTPESFRKLVRM